MCGIVGYIGNRDVKEVLLNGLSKLEYRGYDSAGIALKTDDEISIFKENGRLDKLAKKNNTNISKTLNTILKAVLIKDWKNKDNISN